jgi:hypothetical protein
MATKKFNYYDLYHNFKPFSVLNKCILFLYLHIINHNINYHFLNNFLFNEFIL